jgi:hypothetical protein
MFNKITEFIFKIWVGQFISLDGNTIFKGWTEKYGVSMKNIVLGPGFT